MKEAVFHRACEGPVWPTPCRTDATLPVRRLPANSQLWRLSKNQHKRHSWLFSDSERADRGAAAILSLLATAKLNGLEPYAWRKDTFKKLPAWPYSCLDEFCRCASAALIASGQGGAIERLQSSR